MATFIGTANGVDTGTLPSHQAGDLIVAWAYRDNSTTAPSLPAGQNWTNVLSGGGLTNSGRLAAKVATSSAEGVGTFTNARNTTVAIYRPGIGETLSIGVSAQTGGTSDPVAWSALTLAAGTSWVIGVAGHREINTTLGTPFTGMTNRSNYIDPSSFTESALHDTNGGVSSWSSGSSNVGGTASGYRTAVMEMVVTSGGASYTLTAASGSFALSGQAASLKASRYLLSAQGAFILTGQAVTLTYTPAGGSYTITAASGSFSLSGPAAGLKASRRLVSAPGSLALAGQSVTLKASRKIGAGQVSFSLSGQAARLAASRKIILDAGAFVLTGQDASFVYSSAGSSYTLAAGPGAFVLSGQSAGLRAFRKLTASRGLFVLTGNPASLTTAESSFVAIESRLFAPRIQRAFRSPDVARRLDAPNVPRRFLSAGIARSLQAPAIKRKLYS